MIKLTTVKIKDNSGLRGVMASKGLDASILTTPRVLIESEKVNDKIHELILSALSGLMNQIADFAEKNGVSGTDVMQSMVNNVDNFRLDAGSGYTQVRKEQLVAEGVLTMEEFEPKGTPKIIGGSAVVTADLDLDI